MVYLYYKHQKDKPVPSGKLEHLPRVTIQLPTYKEMYVVKRLITAACNVDYPKELLDVQVLDDSTDETAVIAQECVNDFKKQGFDINYIHRSSRVGFKGGALAEGLKTARGEYIAVFDADFVPQGDVLQKTIHFFSDKSVGMVQTRWSFLNNKYSLLTRIQTILLDGHFVISMLTQSAPVGGLLGRAGR